jgi:hypothetical protein
VLERWREGWGKDKVGGGIGCAQCASRAACAPPSCYC